MTAHRLPNASPLYGELGCAHGVGHDRVCPACAAEHDRAMAAVGRYGQERWIAEVFAHMRLMGLLPTEGEASAAVDAALEAKDYDALARILDEHLPDSPERKSNARSTKPGT